MVRLGRYYIHMVCKSSFEELNISDPDLIVSIHKQYVAAGADVIQTNTYGRK